ncbi:glucuronate isomerase [Thermodesulfobacteriota bacterium]
MHKDRLFPPDPGIRDIARRLYREVADFPIVSPHGHTDPAGYAEDIYFKNPAELFIIPDHYIFRMLYSQGIPLEDLGVPGADGRAAESDPRIVWRRFAEYYYLFRGTPSRLWFEYILVEVFGIFERLGPDNADKIYDAIQTRLDTPEFRIRALFDRFNIEVLSTTDSPLDDLTHHAAIRDSDWKGRVIPAFRPDTVIDPEFKGFSEGVARLGELTGENTGTWTGYLRALSARREFFKSMGAVATDHGHPTAATADLGRTQCERLLTRALQGDISGEEAEQFRAQMLTEMAGMSLEDGLVMQIHPGAFRDHSRYLFTRFGRDKGADIPTRVNYVTELKPLLDKYGSDQGLRIILFTLDESAYSRELAPLAGVYPCLRLGPAWWFHDSPEGMLRFRRMTTETAGFYNTVGFNDDTRAFLSIPARHDVARRVDCSYLAELVAAHHMDEDEALQVGRDLAYNLAKSAYRL